jgi:delta14-sterol reductase
MLELLPITAETLGRASLWVSAFVLLLFVLSRVLPIPYVEGFRTPAGTHERYRLTGLPLFFLTLGGVVACFFGGISLTPLLTHFWSLLLVANVLAFGLLGYLFVRGRRRVPHIERDSRLPAFVHDLWFGIELNPRLFGVDLKMFLYQPSLLGLAVLNSAFLFAQHDAYGTVSPEMWLYQGFTWSYLFTHYVKEHFMLSTWDILAENLGFMLVWGDLVYVPFLYSLCGWWIVDRGFEEGAHEPWPVAGYVALLLFHVVSHWIFREANWQKDRFKRNPERAIWGKQPQTLDGRLLVSGWWGIGRKINYTGEIGVYVSFALCAGFSSPWPYVLPLTLVVLLTQRAGRDDRRCRAKYGALWERYCERARFRVFPGIY